jgi:hypothetical protein
MQDLRLKRGKLARTLRVDDPLEWLNKVVTKVMGRTSVSKVEAFGEPALLIRESKKRSDKFVFIPLSPA